MIATLFQLGGVQFQVMQVNVQEFEHEVGGDYAAKDVVGAMRPREFMGPADDKVTMAGVLFPHKFGGVGGISALQMMAESGEAQMLVRGDGSVFGFYVIERVTDKHAYIDMAGVGRMIEFEVELVKSPNGPSARGAMSTFMSLFG